MTWNAIVNSTGLLLDIGGVILLFLYGIPNKVDPEGTIHRISRGVDAKEVEKGKVYKRWSNIAILLILLGFVLQLISNFINN